MLVDVSIRLRRKSKIMMVLRVNELIFDCTMQMYYP